MKSESVSAADSYKMQAQAQDGQACQTFSLSAADGTALFCRLWSGKSDLPVLIYLHGIEGHGQWFSNTAARLAESGVTVYAPDRRGAGLSGGERGSVSDMRVWLTDLELLLIKVKERHPEAPLFLAGNCWGARLAIAGLQSPLVAGLGLKGLVLICPALFVKIDVGLLTKLSIAWSYLTGSKVLFDLPISPDMFTRDAHYLSFIENDPLRLTAASASFLIEGLKLATVAGKSHNVLGLPVLLLQAGRDRIVDLPRLRRWFDKLGSKGKQLVVFPEAEHSLDFDSCADEYGDYLADWLISAGSRA
jgi:alpha-beta hydrolase superfamily lysophospholipase